MNRNERARGDEQRVGRGTVRDQHHMLGRMMFRAKLALDPHPSVENQPSNAGRYE